MCLGIPGQIVEIYHAGDLLMGRVDYGGVQKEACLAYVPEATVGDYVIVHAGFAISLINDHEAQQTLELLGQLARAQGSSTDGGPGL